jgi:hypothetical protein
MKKILLALLSAIPLFSLATHERAGEITYRCLGGLTYEVTVTLYSRGTSTPTDRCFINVSFGDGDTVQVCRSNFEPGDPTTDPWGAIGCSNPDPPCHHMGEWSMFDNCLNIKRNIYVTNHTFAGPGTYVISITDFTRVDYIVNIPNNNAFYIQDTLKISPWFQPCTSSPTFINPPLDTAHVGVCHVYNPMAVDPDGDSLSYQLISCLGDSGKPIAGYYIPPGVSVDSVTGNLTWCSPPSISNPNTDIWNFAIRILKWRKISNQYFLAGTVLRDIEIYVNACAGMGIEENHSRSSVKLFPNPASDFLHVQTNNKNGGTILLVYDFTGKQVLEKRISEEENFLLSLEGFRNGLYLLQAYSNEKNIFSEKFQVQH